jgi:hypothetical protein
MIPGYHLHLFNNQRLAAVLERLELLEMTGAACTGKKAADFGISYEAVADMMVAVTLVPAMVNIPHTPEGTRMMTLQLEDLLWHEELSLPPLRNAA